MDKKTQETKIILIDEALLNNVSGGDGEGPGDCSCHSDNCCETEEL